MAAALWADTESAMNKHAALSQTEFDALLTSLAPRRDLAGEKYEAVRRMLTRYFEWRHCLPPEDYADETIDRVARRLAGGERIRTGNPISYFRGVARNVWLEWRKQNARKPSTIILSVAEPPRVQVCVERCLNTLSPDGRQLLEAYYLSGRSELIARLGVTPNAVRLRVFKEKQRLRSCMARCLALT
jgi:DNA-directed RNA polymerase specialized sigma24 family protein